MPRILVNIDVDDLEKAVAFYTEAFELQVARRLGPDIVELSGAQAPIFLLMKPAGTPVSAATAQTRDYGRHWTPVHLDFAVRDIDQALARAVSAGARAESDIATHAWGRIVFLSDPFGHGICLLQFSDAGYDALAAG